MFRDPILQNLVKSCPAPKFVDRSGMLFEALVESVISQQLSVKAADTIFLRFKNLFGGIKFPKPQDVVKKDDEELRSVGLSYAKASYVKSVADAFISGLIDPKQIKSQSDEEIIQALTQIRGVGRWTAEMILIFALKRPDVFSVDDNGIQRAITSLYGITDKKEMVRLSESWKPHRSAACWYLWKSLEM